MLSIPLNVMILPRGCDFVYTALEFERMQEEVRHAKTLGVDGFVFGILQQDNTGNLRQNEILVQLTAHLPCTFHRAFDEVAVLAKALEGVISSGFTAIPAACCEPNAEFRASDHAQLVQLSNKLIRIMRVGGLSLTDNLPIGRITEAPNFQSSALSQGR